MKQGMNQHGRQERELPLLAGIGALVTWCEELLAILSGPILTFGLAIALVALLTDGQLLTRAPAFLWIWACSQAVGLDSQFIGSAAKLARAIRRRAWGAIIGYILLCVALGYVGFLASNVFATQEANGITTAEALARLGMDSTSWVLQRSLLAVALVFLSGFLRYVAPALNTALSAEEEKARLLADLELEPLRAQKRALQARGARSVFNAVVGKETFPITEATLAASQTQESPSEPLASAVGQPPHTPYKPPTGPGSPTRRRREAGSLISPDSNVVPMPATRQRKPRRIAASNRAKRGPRTSVEAKARGAYKGGMSASELARVAGIGLSAASKWKGIIEAEHQTQAAQ